jgi:hypothetical protein
MTEQHTEILSAFLDGEAVDPDAFAAALSDPAARAALVEFARLRAEIAGEPEPCPASLSTLRSPAGWLRKPIPLGAAAALLVLMLVAGWMLPRPAPEQSGAEPPQPTRTVSFEPGVDWRSLQ